MDSYYEYHRPEVAALVPTTAKRILDVGCAAGKLGGLLKERQACHVTGVDTNLEASCEAAKVLDRAICADIEKRPDTLNVYDCIICSDVLEHLVDPWTTLDRLLEHLEPGGHLVVSMPNVRNLDVISDLLNGRWEYQPAGILDRTHLRFFTPEGFANELTSRGLTISETRGVGPAIEPFEGFASLRMGRFVVQNCTHDDIQQFVSQQILYLAQKEE
jgi:2-polyprenyl-3-methyl-5-hydroxy-6-metoxy-1,4-benzoquinol methylase